MHTRHLPCKLRPLLLDIPRKHVRLGIEVIRLGNFPPTTFPRTTQRRHPKPILIQPLHHPRRRVSNIPPLSHLNVIRIPPARDPLLRRRRAAVRPEEGLPVLRDAEDGVGAGEGGAQGGGVIEVGGDDVGAEGGEGEGRGRGGIAGQGADGVARVLEEPAGDGAALVSGGADDDEEFLLGGFGHGVGWGWREGEAEGW